MVFTSWWKNSGLLVYHHVFFLNGLVGTLRRTAPKIEWENLWKILQIFQPIHWFSVDFPDNHSFMVHAVVVMMIVLELLSGRERWTEMNGANKIFFLGNRPRFYTSMNPSIIDENGGGTMDRDWEYQRNLWQIPWMRWRGVVVTWYLDRPGHEILPIENHTSRFSWPLA